MRALVLKQKTDMEKEEEMLGEVVKEAGSEKPLPECSAGAKCFPFAVPLNCKTALQGSWYSHFTDEKEEARLTTGSKDYS